VAARGRGGADQEGQVEVVEEGEEEGRVFSFQRDQVREVVLQSCATLQLAVMELETILKGSVDSMGLRD
jgi:hypothetical protein